MTAFVFLYCHKFIWQIVIIYKVISLITVIYCSKGLYLFVTGYDLKTGAFGVGCANVEHMQTIVSKQSQTERRCVWRRWGRRKRKSFECYLFVFPTAPNSFFLFDDCNWPPTCLMVRKDAVCDGTRLPRRIFHRPVRRFMINRTLKCELVTRRSKNQALLSR